MPEKRKAGRPKSIQPKDFSLTAKATLEHFRAIRELADRTRRTVSTEILMAIEAWLEREGLWPPKKKGK